MKPTLTQKEARKLTGLELIQLPDTGDETVAVSYFGRPFVIVQDGMDFIPYWMSTGRGHKENVKTGRWYPIVGMSARWINKESDGIIHYYGSKRLRKYAEILDRTILFLNEDGSGNDDFKYELPVLKAECLDRFINLANTCSPSPCRTNDSGNVYVTANLFLERIHEKAYYRSCCPDYDEYMNDVA